MILESSSIEPNQAFDCDVCVIGGGPAGITVSTKLAESGIDVVLVESGGRAREPVPESQAMYEGKFSITAPNGTLLKQDDTYLASSRLKGLGGSTNHWANWVRPLNRIDFEKRDWIPDSGWPISRADIDRFYTTAYEMCGVSPVPSEPPQSLEQGTRFDIFNKSIFDTQIYHIGLPPRSFGEHYKSALENSKNIRVILGGTINRLKTNKDKKVISEVQGITRFGKPFSVKPKLIVLAGGGIENARILLANRDENGVSIANSSGLVGRFFMEHIHLTFGQALFLHKNPSSLEYYNALSNFKRVGVFSINSAAQREHRVSNIQFDIDPISEEAKDKTTHGLDAITRRLNSPISSKFLRLRFILSQAPNRDSRISLQEDEIDAAGLPKIQLDCRLSELDLFSIKKTMELLRAQLGKGRQGYVRDLIDPTSSWEGQNFEGAFSFYGYHHLGTTRMSASHKDGVVDKNCCAHDIANLYIAGSSVFVTAGHAPPTLTIVALALRLAEHLKKKFKK